ncbi:MAG: hypothetical protein Q7J51_13030, partial [Sheuella sp.]|nr:hypothetical protein [Sheuella sp.]
SCGVEGMHALKNGFTAGSADWFVGQSLIRYTISFVTMWTLQLHGVLLSGNMRSSIDNNMWSMH